jgi:tetratricopeptide (TPR) repeat protein
LSELAQCLRLHQNDSEAQGLEAAWKGPAAGQAGGANLSGGGEPKADPLERIARNFDAQAFRQAAQMLDQVDATKLAALTPEKRAQALTVQAKEYLDRGLLLEAERLYLAAESADSAVAAAHTGLAEVRERTGDGGAARNEARAALQLSPSVDAYLVLARLDFAGGRLDDADKEAGEALKLDGTSRAAVELRRQIEAKGALKK